MMLTKKDLLLLVSGIVLFIIFVIVAWFTIFGTSQNKGPDLNKDYSKFNLIKPGESTLADVEKINGKPDSTNSSAGKTYLYYKTPLENIKNVVLIESNKVVYAQEAVYGTYRGTLKQLTDRYGTPPLILYQRSEDYIYPWYIYLKDGLVVKNDGEHISRLVYFVPQDENSFMQNVGNSLGLSEKPTINQDQPEGNLVP